jgi:hypothetical protein
MTRRKKPSIARAKGCRAGGAAFGESGVALDFLHDKGERGRAIRVLSVLDAYTRERLAVEVDTSFASRRVTRVQEAIVAERGQPQVIRCDRVSS